VAIFENSEMNSTTIIILVAIVALIIVIAARSGGPSVTHVERCRERDDGGDGE